MFFTESNGLLPVKEKIITYERVDHLISYVAALYKFEEFYCTGLLISEKHILTVATCLKQFFFIPRLSFPCYHARLKYALIATSDHRYRFEKVEIHENFDLATEDFDDNIGLVTVIIINS